MVRAKGFTLIELTVVLMILIALAGILVPQLSGYVGRSHAASTSSNITEINKSMQLFQVKYLQGWPDRYDSLLTPLGAVPTYVGLDSASFVPGNIVAQVQADSFNDAGITAAFEHVAILPPGSSATFNSVLSSSKNLAATGTGVMVVMSDAAALATFGSGLDSGNEKYVVLGLGQNCTAVGKIMADAPLHFDQADPAVLYSRFLVVFAIPEDAAVVGFKARYIGALGSEGNGLQAEIGEYYNKDAK